ncbi:hypothetical protein AB5J62_15070 [Amycolatopsis sp. cg5]|uniref:hypothetical protein n=1 Tax=Amycolatopsis sp. cg5 TaxID=3238802 RepID=UPI0035241108
MPKPNKKVKATTVAAIAVTTFTTGSRSDTSNTSSEAKIIRRKSGDGNEWQAAGTRRNRTY